MFPTHEFTYTVIRKWSRCLIFTKTIFLKCYHQRIFLSSDDSQCKYKCVLSKLNIHGWFLRVVKEKNIWYIIETYYLCLTHSCLDKINKPLPFFQPQIGTFTWPTGMFHPRIVLWVPVSQSYSTLEASYTVISITGHWKILIYCSN